MASLVASGRSSKRGAIRGGNLEALEAVRESLAGLEGSFGSGLMGEAEVELRTLASSGSFLAVAASRLSAKGRLDEVDADDEREDFNRTGLSEGETEGLAELSCLIAATRALLISRASSQSPDGSRLIPTVDPSSTEGGADDSLLSRTIAAEIGAILKPSWSVSSRGEGRVDSAEISPSSRASD